MKTRITCRKFHRCSRLVYWVLSCRSPVDGVNYSVELAELSSNLQRGCDSRKPLADSLRQARKLLRERALQPRTDNSRDDNVKFYLIFGRLFLAKDTNTPPRPRPRQIAEWLDEGLRLHVLPALAGPHAIRLAYAAGWEARGVVKESLTAEAPANPIRAALERLLPLVKPKYNDPDEMMEVMLAIAAARAALAAAPLTEGKVPGGKAREQTSQLTLGVTELFPPGDDEIKAWADSCDCVPPETLVDEDDDDGYGLIFRPAQFYETVRAALAHWGRPAPPPAEGEVGELVAWLTERAVQAADCKQPMAAGMLTWAAEVASEHADLLEQRQAAEPQRLHSADPVAWLYRGEPDYAGQAVGWRENWQVTTSRQLAEYKSRPHAPIPLVPAHALPLPSGEGGHG